MPAPSLMFEESLTALKGWFQPAALDFVAKLSADVDFDVPRGRVVHVNAAGEFETGIDETDMAIFLWPGSNDFDVSNPGTTPKGNFMHQAIAPAGNLSGLVATGAYELASTEFDDSLEYAPGDLLTAFVDNADEDVGGVLTNERSAGNPVRQYEEPVCGVVSRGKYNNEHGIAVLAFWPVYLPGAFT
jgi:hypothetical protein